MRPSAIVCVAVTLLCLEGPSGVFGHLTEFPTGSIAAHCDASSTNSPPTNAFHKDRLFPSMAVPSPGTAVC